MTFAVAGLLWEATASTKNDSKIATVAGTTFIKYDTNLYWRMSPTATLSWKILFFKWPTQGWWPNQPPTQRVGGSLLEERVAWAWNRLFTPNPVPRLGMCGGSPLYPLWFHSETCKMIMRDLRNELHHDRQGTYNVNTYECSCSHCCNEQAISTVFARVICALFFYFGRWKIGVRKICGFFLVEVLIWGLF